MEVLLEPVEVVEVTPWGQSTDGEFVIIGSYCGDPVTDGLMREAEQRTRSALKGLPAMLGISSPPSITIRPMCREGVSRGLYSERRYGESIAITPWFASEGLAYPRMPGQIRLIVMHEVAHWLAGHAGYTGPSHGAVFTAILMALIARSGAPRWYISKVTLYDIGFDDIESTSADRPSWAGDHSESWAMWLPWAIRVGQRYGRTDWPASRIASVIVARRQRYADDRHERRWLQIHDLVSGQTKSQSIIDAYADEHDQLCAALEDADTREKALLEQSIAHEKSFRIWRRIALAMIFCLALVGVMPVHS